jgi:hypothetical protein
MDKGIVFTVSLEMQEQTLIFLRAITKQWISLVAGSLDPLHKHERRLSGMGKSDYR